MKTFKDLIFEEHITNDVIGYLSEGEVTDFNETSSKFRAMSNLLITSQEILDHFTKGEEIPAFKFLQLEIAIQQERANNEKSL